MSSIRWTDEQYEQWRQSRGTTTADTRAAVSVADVESDSKHESTAKDAGQKVSPRFRIHVHSKRWRLADPDGISAKACIDGLVSGGILADDSAKEVQSVTFSQERIAKSEFEETVIEIWELL